MTGTFSLPKTIAALKIAEDRIREQRQSLEGLLRAQVQAAILTEMRK